MADPEGFLARWSRLKQQARQPQQLAADAPAEAVPEALPPVESLTAESDFSAFMQPGVPESLRNAALQKLWRSDPVYANLDGLVEYGEDYAAELDFGTAVATLYRVLEGMPEKSEPAPQSAPETPAAAPAISSGAATETGEANDSAVSPGGLTISDELG